jgi:NAD(P)-dependent dehydrogenase (short-subunit alcohol dehydrogenase family)
MAPAPFPSPTKTWHDTSYPSISPTLPALSASGKSVLITGGGTGIGAGTAHSFAQAGASRIAILGRREANLRSTAASIKAKHPSVEVLTLPTDVTDASAVNAAFAAFLPAGKTLDILVHSAAVVGPHAPVATVEPAEFLDTVTNIVSGALYVAQAFARHAAPGAVAIEINSSAAHINFGPGLTAYSTAKLAAFRLWDSLGYAGKENGWRVYHVQPGVVDSEMNRSAGGVKAMGFEDHGECAFPAVWTSFLSFWLIELLHTLWTLWSGI